MKINVSQVMIVLFALAATAGAGTGYGYTAGDKRDHSVELQSSFLGETVPLTIHLPAGYHLTARRYPVLYILEDDPYGRAMTGIVDARSRLGYMPEMIVVGIGTNDRWRDFTPTRTGVPGGEVIPTSGGGGLHRRFLAEELIPFIESEFRTESFRMLFGHSIAGLHAVTTMFEEPGLIRAVMATGPSLWWDGEMATSIMRNSLGSTPGRRGILFLAVGNEDETIRSPLGRFCASLQRSVLFIPDIDSWEEWDEEGERIEDMIALVDVAYLDASFYWGREMPGRDMSAYPHPFITHSMERFGDLPASEKSKIRFIHLNHTNPAIWPDGEARRAVEENGFGIAEEGERVVL